MEKNIKCYLWRDSEKMIKLLFTIIGIILLNLLHSQNEKEAWDNYIAAYENNKPGSTTVRMDLIEGAPIDEYPMVLITGISYESSRADGFPEKDSTFDLLHQVGGDLVNFLSERCEFIHVGSFMYDLERLEYFAIKEEGKIKSDLEEFYKVKYPKKKYYINVKKDSLWSYYRDFLYPNEETQHYMSIEKILMNLREAGDDLSEARRTDHWITN